MTTVLTNEEYLPRTGTPRSSVLVAPDVDRPIRGRAAERTVVAEALARLEDGAGAVLIVRGPSGIGKTRLLEDTVARATAAGLRVAEASTDRDARLIPLTPVMDAFGTGPRPISDRSRFGSIARDQESRYWLLQQLQDDIERAAASSGVVVVIDDLQWCDTTTLAVLRSLSRRLADLPVLWVLAVRAEDLDPSVLSTVDDLAATGRVVDLEPLSDDATAAMIGDLFGVAPDDTVLRAARRTENTPLLVVELVRGLLDEELVEFTDGRATMPGPTLPATFGASVRETVRRLSKPTQQIVQVGAVLGRSFDVRSLAALLDQPVHRLLPGLQEAIDAGVLVDGGEQLAFRHDVLREAAESMIPLAVRDALVRQGAEELLRQGVEPLSVASRIADVARPGDVDAAELLRTVAIDLAETDAAQASAFALRAVDIARDTAILPGIVLDVLPLLWHSGRVTEARALTARLDGRLGPEDEGRLRLTTARLQTESSAADALRSVETALELPGLSDGLRSRLLALRALNLAHVGRHEDLRVALDGSPDGPGSDQTALATFEASASVLAFNQGRFADAGRLITAAMSRMAGAEQPSTTWLPEGLWAAFLANSLGDTDRAGRIAEANAIETRSNHLARATASWMMLRTRVLFDQGDLEGARTLAEAVLDLAQDLELGGFAALTAGSVLFRIALVQADRGGTERYRHFAESLCADPTFERAGSWLLALEAESAGAIDDAVAFTEPAWRTLDAPVSSMSSPADFADDVHLARIALRSGRHDRAERVERTARRRSEANPENDLCAGTWLHVRGLVTGSADSLRAAVARLRGVPRRLVLAAALEDLGRLVHDEGAAGAGPPAAASAAATAATRVAAVAEASEAWQESARLFHDAAANRDAERVRRRLREVGVVYRSSAPDRTVTGLTARESQVVERVAAGLTTQQIASDLFISTHTVVSHVRHVYTKWGVSSRRELAARFTAHRAG